MLGTQRTLSNVNFVLEELSDVESVWVKRRLEPSPIIMSSEPEYKVWRDRLLRSAGTWWWETPLSSSHFGVSEVLFAAKWARGCHGVGKFVAGALGFVVGWIGTKRTCCFIFRSHTPKTLIVISCFLFRYLPWSSNETVTGTCVPSKAPMQSFQIFKKIYNYKYTLAHVFM